MEQVRGGFSRIHFVVDGASVKDKETGNRWDKFQKENSLGILGDIPALGCWDSKRAIKGRYDPIMDCWHIVALVKRNAQFEYKLVAMKNETNEVFQWERERENGNRTHVADKASEIMMLYNDNAVDEPELCNMSSVEAYRNIPDYCGGEFRKVLIKVDKTALMTTLPDSHMVLMNLTSTETTWRHHDNMPLHTYVNNATQVAVVVEVPWGQSASFQIGLSTPKGKIIAMENTGVVHHIHAQDTKCYDKEALHLLPITQKALLLHGTKSLQMIDRKSTTWPAPFTRETDCKSNTCSRRIQEMMKDEKKLSSKIVSSWQSLKDATSRLTKRFKARNAAPADPTAVAESAAAALLARAMSAECTGTAPPKAPTADDMEAPVLWEGQTPRRKKRSAVVEYWARPITPVVVPLVLPVAA